MNMKSNPVAWAAVLFAGLLVLGCTKESAEQRGKGTIWTCSMHPQVEQDHPGDCPICGMALVPKVAVPAVGETPVGREKEGMDMKDGAPTIQLGRARESVASIGTVQAGPRELVKKIQLFGEVDYISDRHVDYSWYYPGRIQKVLVDFNTEELAKGQPVYEVYSEAAIADQEAYLDVLRERWLATFYERRVLDAKLDAVKARLEQAGFTEEDFRLLEKEKKVKTTFVIRSPEKGALIGTFMHQGNQFAAGDVLLHVVPLDQVWFVAQVYESDLGALKQGQDVHIETKAEPGVFNEGKLVYTGRSVDPKTRTVIARFEVDNPNRSLLPGMSAIGLLEAPLKEAPVALPASAVIDTGTRKLVYVKTGEGQYVQREVSAGMAADNYVEILSGVQAGEQVVVDGAFLLDAEAQLQGSTISMPEEQEKKP